MAQVHKLPNTREIAKKGRQIFETLSPELTAEHRGRFVAIEVEPGSYCRGETGVEATRKAQAQFPEKFFFLGRIV